jgi:hypothetical protein
MPLANAVNGSTTSARPSGVKILHLCLCTNPFNFGSTLIKNASASSSSVSLLDVAVTAAPTSGATISRALRFLTGDGSDGFVGEEA